MIAIGIFVATILALVNGVGTSSDPGNFIWGIIIMIVGFFIILNVYFAPIYQIVYSEISPVAKVNSESSQDQKASALEILDMRLARGGK